MKLIAHRGNTRGSNPERENSPNYILETIDKEFDVEIDVWLIDEKFYLGHDKPQYEIYIDFLLDNSEVLWCHAKNISALNAMLQVSDIHCFWHQTDDVVLTSKGYIWTYPGKEVAKNKAIAVMPETVNNWDILPAFGMCSDQVSNILNEAENKLLEAIYEVRKVLANETEDLYYQRSNGTSREFCM